MSRYLISVDRWIPADARRLFDVLANPAMHPVIDGSGTVRAVMEGSPPRLHPDAEFGMDMHLGTRYRITNRVIEFDEPRLIGWRHFNGHVWRYLLRSVNGGTLVTEQWDARRVWNRAVLVLLGFHRRNRGGMVATLERLAAPFETPATATRGPVESPHSAARDDRP